MPELPEVETMANALKNKILHKQIKNVVLTNKKIINYPEAQQFVSELLNRTIVDVSRRGKYIIISLDDGAKLIAHMRMTGRLYACPSDTEEEKHTHLILDMDDNISIRYTDTRRFGRLWLGQPDDIYIHSGMNKLGIEPLDPNLNREYMRSYLKRRKKAIKSCLLDQNFIAGIGNIYSDEILHNAHIHPGRPGNTLSDEEIDRLVVEIPKVIGENVVLCEETADEFFKNKINTYRNGDNIRIYNHAGEPCPDCGTELEKSTIGQRTSTYCPTCQV